MKNKEKKTNDFPVDIVIPWVNGNDPEWLKEKQKYLAGGNFDEISTAENRFRDWDLMPIWFKSIDTFMPWVRTIHLITWGHLPEGLPDPGDKDREGLPSVHIVNHRDILPEDALPTFNSKAIEINMHRIEGLAEHFIYFNDDLFPNKHLKKSDFFDLKSGLPKLYFEEIPLSFMKADREWSIMQANCLGIANKYNKKQSVPLKKYPGKYLSRHFMLSSNIRSLTMKLLFPSYYVGFRNLHTVSVLRKSVLEDVWEKEPEMMNSVTHMKFRENSGINQWVFLWYQLASGQFKPSSLKCNTYNVSAKLLDEIGTDILLYESDIICLEDPDFEIDFERCRNAVKWAFEKKFEELQKAKKKIGKKTAGKQDSLKNSRDQLQREEKDV